MNKVILIGNLTKEPELNATSGGVSVCKFTLAVQRKFKNANDEYETDFINIVVWRTLAENCHKFLHKGNKAGIVGTLQTRSYDAQDGTKRYVTEVVADEVEFLVTNKKDETSGKEDNDITKLQPIDDNSLPF